MARLLPAAPALAAIVLAACADVPTGSVDPASTPSFSHNGNSPAVQVFRVKLDELNGSGVRGTATLLVKNGELVVTLNAVDHAPSQLHPQHIHGFDPGVESTCPTAAHDTDGDGVITFAEGAPAFGPVQVDLQPYPTPANAAGSISYRGVFTPSFAPSDLPDKTMVLHGDFSNGAYVASLPVACGQVEPVN
ncbi:MAG TPA: hypothetical protein VF192_05610 [Longimicrobiales bacterium]